MILYAWMHYKLQRIVSCVGLNHLEHHLIWNMWFIGVVVVYLGFLLCSSALQASMLVLVLFENPQMVVGASCTHQQHLEKSLGWEDCKFWRLATYNRGLNCWRLTGDVFDYWTPWSSHHSVGRLSLIYFALWHLCTGHIWTGTLQRCSSLANWQLLRHYIRKLLIFWQGSTQFIGFVVKVVNIVGEVCKPSWGRQTMLATFTAIFCVATVLHENIGIMAACVEFLNRWNVVCGVYTQLPTCDGDLCMNGTLCEVSHIGLHYKSSYMYPYFLNVKDPCNLLFIARSPCIEGLKDSQCLNFELAMNHCM